MKAAVWLEAGDPKVSVEELEPFPLRPHDVLVRIEAANVSLSDHIPLVSDPRTLGQPTPQVLGHAGAGTVEEIGSAVERVRVGDRVIATSTPNCHICHFCTHGRPDHCSRMVVVGPPHAKRTEDGTPVHPNASVGSFADLAVIPDIQLTSVYTDLPSEQLALIANPVGTGVGVALRTAPVAAGSVAVAVGCGPVGLSFVQGARIAGAAQIIAVDPIPERRDAALRFGATSIVDPLVADPIEAVLELTEDVGGVFQGRGGDYVFESAGEEQGIEQAWAMTRATGHVTLSSVCRDMTGATVTFPALPFALSGKTVHSCQYGSLNQLADLPWLVGLAERDQLDLSGMIDHRYPLAEVETALRAAADRTAIGSTILPQT